MPQRRPSTFGIGLRNARIAAGLTQTELARRVGRRKSHVTHLELGLREPSWSMALELAAALGVSVEVFVVQEGTAMPKTKGPRMGRPRKRPQAVHTVRRPVGRPRKTAEANKVEPGGKKSHRVRKKEG